MWASLIASCIALVTSTDAQAIQIVCEKSWKPEFARNVEAQVSEVMTDLHIDHRTANALQGAVRRWTAGSPPQCVELTVSGSIEEGDAKRLANALMNEPLVTQINLFSPGGDVYEAIEMARLVRENLILVHVPHFPSCSKAAANRLATLCDPQSALRKYHAGPCINAKTDPAKCVCASACVMVLAGAVQRQIGSGFRDVRYEAGVPTLFEVTNIGIHRPSASWFRSVATADTMAAMQHVRDAISRSLVEFEVPGEMLDLMYQTASDKIRFLMGEEVERMLPMLTPTWEEKTLQVCGGTFADNAKIKTDSESGSRAYRLASARLSCILVLRTAESSLRR